jgi:hypothetical protein
MFPAGPPSSVEPAQDDALNSGPLTNAAIRNSLTGPDY